VTITYPFTEQEMTAASQEWGCNCGPSALAFALQKPLNAARHAIPGFDQKRYTSPMMMKAALAFLDREFVAVKAPHRVPQDVEPVFAGPMSLVRVQWTGPWTAPGANPKWAYRQTHWIAAWAERGVPLVFDCNGGIRGFTSWESEIVPLILKLYPRADGGWFFTNVWRLLQKGGAA
jgi:hypothetical protein